MELVVLTYIAIWFIELYKEIYHQPAPKSKIIIVLYSTSLDTLCQEHLGHDYFYNNRVKNCYCIYLYYIWSVVVNEKTLIQQHHVMTNLVVAGPVLSKGLVGMSRTCRTFWIWFIICVRPIESFLRPCIVIVDQVS